MQPTGPTTMTRHLVLAALCLLAMIAYIQRSCIAVASTQIQSDLSIGVEQMGWAMSAFFWSYTLLQIPTGRLVDAFGSRRMQPVFATLFSLSTIWSAFAMGFWGFLFSRVAGGIGQAGIFPAAVNSFSKWYPKSERSMPNGMLASFMSVGLVLANTLTGWFMEWTTWQAIFVAAGLTGILWSVPFYVWFRDRPEEHAGVNAAELAVINEGRDPDVHGVRVSTPWLAIVSSLSLWLICGQQFFRAAGYVFYQTWFPTYLQQAYQVSVTKSGILGSLPVLAIVIGSPIAGILGDWIFARTNSLRLARQGVAIPSLLLCGGFILAAYFIAHPTLAVIVISIGSFFFSLAGPASYSVTIDVSGPHVTTVFAAMNMCGNLGASVCPIVVAFIASAIDWVYVLPFFAAVYVAAALCWAFIDPNARIVPVKPDHENTKA